MRAAFVATLASTTIALAILSSVALAQSTLRSAEQLLELRKPVEREIVGKDVHFYRIAARKGQFIDGAVEQRGIDLVVTVIAPNGKTLRVIDSPNGDQGDEPFSIVAEVSGMYRIEVKTLDEPTTPGRYQARITDVLSHAQYQARLVVERANAATISGWIGSHAIPLRSVVAGSPTADLQPLKNVFRDVRIVALGEATHGTREFFQVKHRLLEFLVKEMGFRIFAIEASQTASENINDYVMGNTTDGEKALESQGFWTWNTHEVRDQLNWMRSYNASVPAGQKVRFVGFDLQLNEKGGDFLLTYLRKLAPERVARIQALPSVRRVPATDEEIAVALEGVAEAAAFGPAEKRPAAAARIQEAQSTFTELLGFLMLNEFELTRKSSPSEFAAAVRYARLIAQYLDSYRPGSPSDMRDRYMAENIIRIMSAEPAGSRMVVWAHNGHIEKPGEAATFVPMGGILARVYGSAYYALGFSFNQGAFQARSQDPKAKLALSPFLVGPAAEGTLDWYFARPGISAYVIDFRHTPRNEAVTAWLAKKQRMRSIGSMYGTGPEEPLGIAAPGTQFDGVLFIDKTTRARPNPTVKNVARETQ